MLRFRVAGLLVAGRTTDVMIRLSVSMRGEADRGSRCCVRRCSTAGAYLDEPTKMIPPLTPRDRGCVRM